MTLRAQVYFYLRRLRVHAMQEALAVMGVAVAVALVFAVTVANSSVVSSAREVVHAVIGPANLQLHARGPGGFDERLLSRVERLPGVAHAAPLLEQTATIVAGNGRRTTVEVAGADTSLAVLDGLAETLPLEALAPGGLGLSQAAASALHLHGTHTRRPVLVALFLRGHRYPLRVSAVLGHETAGALAQARVAVMPLDRLQGLAGLERRITRILVQSAPGREGIARRELSALAAGRLTVAPADQDITLLREALRPSSQASALFAGLSGLLGFLFAFNAMLLTVPERRAAIADLRMEGASRSGIVQMVVFQGLCVGVLACALGLLLGGALSTGLFHQSPGYLTKAFTLGTKTVIGASPIVFAVLGGLVATGLATMVPLQDLRRERALDGASSDGERATTAAERGRRWLALASAALVALATGLFLLAPSTALVACVALALATMLAVPIVLAGVLSLAGLLAERYERFTALALALSSLKSTTVRSLALAATGAVALFGSVALGSSRDDLLRGIDNYTAHYTGSASVWLVNPEDNQAIETFQPNDYATRIRAIAGVRSVESFQGNFLDVGDRRVWLIAWPTTVTPGLLDGQIIHGELSQAQAQLTASGSITVSDQIASEHHLMVGDVLSLPTPAGVRPFKIAATTTNFGWTPGAIVMNTRDYQRYWESAAPSALGVDITTGTNPATISRAIQQAVGPAHGLEVLTAHARETAIEKSASEGLGQLREIATLLMIAAILALAAAIGSSIWQQRRALAELTCEGATRPLLCTVLLWESALLLSAGCLTGAIAGIYGQSVIDSYLKHVTGFPVAGVTTGTRPIEIFAIVTAAVLLIALLPAWLAAAAPAALALED